MQNRESMFTSEQQKALLNIAKETIRALSQNQNMPVFNVKDEKLNQSMGAFVTLTIDGELCGCIGSIEGRGPLWKTIEEMAVSAAFHDPRFPAVSAQQLEKLRIEISVLSPLEKIDDIDEIRVGEHGLYIKSSYSSGLLLPQVASERNWDRLTFLQHTCMKAGLPVDAWQNDETDIFVFFADIFSE